MSSPTIHNRKPIARSNGDPVSHTESSLIQSVLSGGGEMGALMRAFNWSRTPLGPVSQWPQSLRIAVRILLGTGYPMLICWGSDYTMIYNDGYRPILGKTKHPTALGRPIREVFTEAMDFIGPRFDNVLARGEDFTVTDQLFILDRNDYLEECYFTFSYSPAPADDATVGGVLVTALETTERVLDDRRRRILRDSAAEMAKARSEEDVWRAAAATLVTEPLVVPFAALYSYHSPEHLAQLAASAGDVSPTMCPPVFDLDTGSDWPFSTVRATSTELVVEDLEARFAEMPATSWGVPPRKAVILPIAVREHSEPAGFLVAGISPRREFDEPYRQFFQRSAEQIATALTSARAYQEERRRAEVLAELDRAKTVFFSNVSHEFRTPLTLMLGPLEELAANGSSRLGPEEHEQVDVARRNAHRLLKLVNTLLDFSRIEAGRVEAAYEPTDLGRFTAELASVFRSAMEKAGLSFSVECEDLGEPAYVDRDMWEKIVVNLLSNAFKFTLEGGVTLSLKRVDGWIELAVRDTGVGIAEPEQARVFERFHRVENTRARTYEGTGIGLALVYELAKLHSGTVRLESTLGKGSTFTVSIPLGTAHLPSVRIGAEQPLTSTAVSAYAYLDEAERCLPHPPGGTIDELGSSMLALSVGSPGTDAERDLIVIADDNADMRNYLVHLLSQHYRVHAVSGGQQAVEAAQRLHPALVLADVMMPGLDGFGMLNAIRAEESLRSTPVILLSARAGEESRVEGLQAGADDYLVKPFTARELIARVSAHVKMAKLRNEAAEREARLRAEAEHERQRLQELLAQAPAAIGLMQGPEHRWVYVNEDYVRLTGRGSHQDFLGKTVIESLPEIETQVFIKLLDEVYRTGVPYFGRESKVILNRSAVGLPDESYWDFVYQPVRNAGGAIEGVLVHAVEVTDKIVARNAIRESAERLRLAQSAAQIGTWEWDPEKEVRNLSPELHRIFGTEAEDPNHATTWAERVYPGDWGKVERCMEEGYRSGEMDFEYRYSHPKRGLRWFYCKGRRFENQTRMFGIIQDITDRKRAEDALRQSEQQLRMITDATPVMIWLSGTDKLCYYFNKTWLEFVGRSLQQEIGNGWAESVHPEDFDRCLQIYITSFDARQPFEMEYRLRHHSGEYRWILDHGIPRYTPDGTFEGYVGGCLDIHDQKEAAEKVRRANEAVRRSKEILDVALTASKTGTFRWNPQTDSIEVDQNLKSLLGMTPNETLETMSEFVRHVHADDMVLLDFAVDACRAGADLDLEFRISSPAGAIRWLSGRAKRQYEEGQPTWFVGACTDITARKNVETSLRESELWLTGQKQALQAAVNGADLAECLDLLIRTAVKQFEGEARCAFYIANAAGTELRHVAGMPESYAKCVDGFKIGPDSLACGLAVYTGEPQITPDVFEDPLWKPWLWLAEQYEYRGCWSFPVKTSRGKALGTFAMYFKEPRQATSRDLQLANVLTNAAAIIISKHQEAEERVRVERALRENEQRMRLAQQAAGIGAFEWNLHTNENRWTPELEAMYGLAPGRFGGTEEEWERLIHPEDRPHVLRQVQLAIQTGNPIQAEWRTVWPDGSTHWILGRWQAFPDDAGKPACVAGINLDVTARKTAEEAQRHLAAIVESSEDAIASKDLRGIVKSWNRQAERLFGYSAEEMIGQSIRKVIPPELQDDEDRILATIARGDKIEHFETVRLAKDGRRVDVSLTISPMRDETGRIVGASKIVRDITQQKRTEKALRMSERLASVGRLAASVAHEINNPLEAMTNLLYIARTANDPAKIDPILAQAEEELNRVALLSRQTLGFYREKSSPKRLRIGGIVESLVAVYKPKARNKAIQIKLEIRQDPEICAVEGEIRQVIANLISNSIDAIPRNGAIRIRIAASQARDASLPGVRLTIADSGTGIAPENRKKLFEPFFTANKDVGTGLGLWISKGIVERHGGDIRFRSRTVPGSSGTVFTVFLPSDFIQESTEP